MPSDTAFTLTYLCHSQLLSGSEGIPAVYQYCIFLSPDVSGPASHVCMSPDISNFYSFNLFFLSPRRFRSHRWRRSIIYPRAGSSWPGSDLSVYVCRVPGVRAAGDVLLNSPSRFECVFDAFKDLHHFLCSFASSQRIESVYRRLLIFLHSTRSILTYFPIASWIRRVPLTSHSL